MPRRISDGGSATTFFRVQRGHPHILWDVMFQSVSFVFQEVSRLLQPRCLSLLVDEGEGGVMMAIEPVAQVTHENYAMSRLNPHLTAVVVLGIRTHSLVLCENI